MGTIINSKKIKDPLFLSVKKFMDDRLAFLKVQGRSKALERAERRYSGLKATDVIIEPPVTFPNGKIRCCFVSRKTGFFRADVLVETVLIDRIFEEFEITPIVINDTTTFILGIKNGTIESGIYNVLDQSTFCLVLNKQECNIDGVMEKLNDVYWDKISLNLNDSVNDDQTSGTVTVETTNIKPYTFPIYVIEDLKK